MCICHANLTSALLFLFYFVSFHSVVCIEAYGRTTVKSIWSSLSATTVAMTTTHRYGIRLWKFRIRWEFQSVLAHRCGSAFYAKFADIISIKAYIARTTHSPIHRYIHYTNTCTYIFSPNFFFFFSVAVAHLFFIWFCFIESLYTVDIRRRWEPTGGWRLSQAIRVPKYFSSANKPFAFKYTH